jgi:ureidoglycolate hydrolase
MRIEVELLTLVRFAPFGTIIEQDAVPSSDLVCPQESGPP